MGTGHPQGGSDSREGRGGAVMASSVSRRAGFCSKWVLLIGLTAVVSVQSVAGQQPAIDSGYYTYQIEPSPESEKAQPVSDIVVQPKQKANQSQKAGMRRVSTGGDNQSNAVVRRSAKSNAEFAKYAKAHCRDAEDANLYRIWEEWTFKEALVKILMATSAETDEVKLAEERARLRSQVDSGEDLREALKSHCKKPEDEWAAKRKEHEKQHARTFHEHLENEILNEIFANMFTRGSNWEDHFSGTIRIERNSDKDTSKDSSEEDEKK